MTIKQFAQVHRIKVKVDSCREAVLIGRFGHIYDHDGRRFGMLLEAPAGSTRFDVTLQRRRGTGIRAGFRVHCRGDVESVLLFDPHDRTQATVAIALAGIKRKRRASPSQLANLRQGPARTSSPPVVATNACSADTQDA